MKSLPLDMLVQQLLSCGKFSMWEMMWISGTGVRRQRAKMREVLTVLQKKDLATCEFHEELNKSMFYCPQPTLEANPRPSDRSIVYKAKDRNELIDFIKSIYKQFGFLPDKVNESEAFYYETAEKVLSSSYDLVAVPRLVKGEKKYARP